LQVLRDVSYILCSDSVRVRDLFSTGCHPNSYESVTRSAETIGRFDAGSESWVFFEVTLTNHARFVDARTTICAVVPVVHVLVVCARRINFTRLFSTGSLGGIRRGNVATGHAFLEFIILNKTQLK